MKENRDYSLENLYVSILRLLQKCAYTSKDLANILEVEEEQITIILNNLEDNFRIKKNKQLKYSSLEDKDHKVGKLELTSRGYGFVNIEGLEKDVYIPQDKLKGALNGDIVLLYFKKDEIGYAGSIKKILAKSDKKLVGEIKQDKKTKKLYIKPDDPRYKIKINIDTKEDKQFLLKGQKVVFKINELEEKDIYKGSVVEVIGHKDDPGIDVLSVIKAFEIPDTFPKEVLDEVGTINQEVTKEEMADRIDLRNQMIFTIDGIDAKDLDDAISLEIKENGDYVLSVHIADVSHYVKENTHIDNEAKKRGTSFYPVDRVVPMLPHELSNGICSLNELVDRLAFTFQTTINKEGKIIDFQPYLSVINSKKRMDYNTVNKVFDGVEIPSYEPFKEKLEEMNKLAKLLRKNREDRGSIDFEAGETKILFNKLGKPIDVIIHNRGQAEKLIEEFMIITNEASANYISNLNLPFLYRIHDNPREDKIEKIVDILSTIGYNAKKRLKDENIVHAKSLQLVLEDLKNRDDYSILTKTILKAMKKAKYAQKNIGHFGLASKEYAHMTSPIRRYPDLKDHRILKKILFEYNCQNEFLEQLEKELITLSTHLSTTEERAQKAEREVEKMFTAEYMEQQVGKEFEGQISELTQTAIYVQLDNNIQGKVSINSINGCYFDEESYTIRNINKEALYRLGNKVTILVKSASKEEHTINFEIVKKDKVLVKHGDIK